MNKKPARIIAALAFVVLVRPLANAFTFAEEIMRWMLGMPESPCDRLMFWLYEEFGMWAADFAYIAFLFTVPAVASVLIYRYLLRRDFKQVCDDCAAHKVLAWMLFVLFVLFSFTSFSRMFVPAYTEGAPIPLDEAMEESGHVSLEFRLCHPDSDKLVKELSGEGDLNGESLAAAPAIEGYDLLAIADGERITDACYVSTKAELSEADVVWATVRKASSFVNGQMLDDRYELNCELSDEGGRKMRTLTMNYQPGGAKNHDSARRRLAIVVNGRLVVAPYIMSEIGKSFGITGRFSRDEAVSLAAALNSRQRQDLSEEQEREEDAP